MGRITKKRETAEAIVRAQNEILIAEILERPCRRIGYGAADCFGQAEPEGEYTFEKIACASCRARAYLNRKRKGGRK